MSVYCGYEAGRDGFWLHRFLQAHGIQNLVVDASSIEVNRRYRWSKTDRLAMHTLLTMLVRFGLGETRWWQGVRVPSGDAEALRQPHRASIALQEERTQHMNRRTGWLAGEGLEVVIDHTFPERLRALRQWDGQPVLVVLQARLLREFRHAAPSRACCRSCCSSRRLPEGCDRKQRDKIAFENPIRPSRQRG